MRRLVLVGFCFAALLVAVGCDTTSADCYFDGVVVDCSESYCDVTCEDADGFLQCTDVTTDPYNCGDCGATCFDGVCFDSTCEAAGYSCEDSGLTTCTDAAGYDYCADLNTDDFNCGGCGIECPLGCDGAGNCL